MNNWFLKFLLCGFLAQGVGLTAAWLSSFFFWMPNIQKGIGFLAAGLSVIAADIVVRLKIDENGIYLVDFMLPLRVFRIPAWAYGIVIAGGGILLLFSSD